MANDLVGLAAIVILAGGAYILLSNPNILQGSNTGDPGFAEGDTGTDGGTDEVGNTSGGTAGANCGQLCRDKKCSEYKANCKTGCTYCCGSGPNSPSCGGSSSTDVSKCPNCGSNQYRYVDSNGKCGCHTFGGTSTPTKTCPSGYKLSGGSCICSRTTAGCKSGQVARTSGGKCVCTSCSSGYKVSGNNCVCGSVSCCGGCPSGKRKVLINGKCACENIPSPTGSTPSSCPCKQGSKCSGFTGATCCAWRGANGGCSSGFKGVLHPGGGCDCVRSSSYARALRVNVYHTRPNLRTKYRFSGM